MQIADGKLKADFFSQEYLLADSAFPADKMHNTVVPAYRSIMKGEDN